MWQSVSSSGAFPAGVVPSRAGPHRQSRNRPIPSLIWVSSDLKSPRLMRIVKDSATFDRRCAPIQWQDSPLFPPIGACPPYLTV